MSTQTPAGRSGRTRHPVAPAAACDDGATADAAGPGDEMSTLIDRAINHDQSAWRELHGRFSPLIASVCRTYRLNPADAADVAQTVWLRLTEHLVRLRNPRALPGWIQQVCRHEVFRILKAARRIDLSDPQVDPRFVDSSAINDGDPVGALWDEQRLDAVRTGLVELKRQHRDLIVLLFSEPAVSYQEISDRLVIPVGSIGPTRARCVAKLRATSAVRAAACA